MTTPTDQVARYWGDAVFTANLAAIHWMASSVVCGYLNRLASGNERTDWLTHLSQRHLQPRKHRVLVLGCGEGWLERSIASNPNVERIDAYDIAPDAVARAAELAASEGLTNVRYGVLDLNHGTLPREEYELVIAHSVLHHVEDLEHAFPQIANALTADGTLFVNEYVGPMRFQYTVEQMEVINDLMARLPERFRRSAVTEGIYPAKTRPTIEEMIRTDPSEAVRSDELLPFLQTHFEIQESIRYGGTILNHLLYDIVQNFHDEAEPDRTMLEVLCLVEELLISGGSLDSDYHLVVATRRNSPKRSTPAATGSETSAPVSSSAALASVSRIGGRVFGLRGRRRQSDLRGATHPVIRRHLSGESTMAWDDRVRHELSGRDQTRVLVLGERHGEWSRYLADQPEVGSVDVALSPSAPPHPRVTRGIRLTRLAPASYDLVLSLGALSMSSDPVRDMDCLARSMKSESILLAEEYVGLPMRRMRIETAQVLDRLLRIVPGEQRNWSRRLRDEALQFLTGGTPRAGELPAILERFLPGCRIEPATSLLLQNFLAARPGLLDGTGDDAIVLDLICALEKWLLHFGVIRADFVTIRAHT